MCDTIPRCTYIRVLLIVLFGVMLCDVCYVLNVRKMKINWGWFYRSLLICPELPLPSGCLGDLSCQCTNRRTVWQAKGSSIEISMKFQQFSGVPPLVFVVGSHVHFIVFS